MAIADVLRACPLFYELFDREIERITHKCRVLSGTQGDILLRKGSTLDALYVILEGRLTADHIDYQVPLTTGDPFGESYLVDERISPAHLIARSDCAILKIQFEDVYSLFEQEPRIFGLLMLNLSRLLARRLQGTEQKVNALARFKRLNSD